METQGSEKLKILERGVAELFLDDSIIANQHKLVRRWLPAKTFPFPVIEPDKPWEQRMITLFGTVLEMPSGDYRIYYHNWSPSHGPCMVFIAQSQDGFRWEKPELGIVDWNGSKANNIVLAPEFYNDGPSIVFDPQDSDQPYKTLLFQADSLATHWSPQWGLYGYTSKDGLNWNPTDPKMPIQAGDRTNLMATRIDGKYVAYTRHKDMLKTVGLRAIYRIESDDFINWTEPELVMLPDLEDEPDVELYGMSVFKRQGWYIGLLEYWRSSVDTIEIHLAYSRDGISWQRPPVRSPFIAAAYDWNSKWNSCASNGALIIKEQMVFYFGGRSVSHHFDTAQQYGAIGYASLPLDRFCALEGASGGVVEMVPIQWPGGDLVINADTRESFDSHPGVYDGEITVEVMDCDGNPLDGWSGDSKAVFRGNTHMRCNVFEGKVKWPDGRSLDELRGTIIQLRFSLKHARLFSIAASEDE